MSTKKHNWRYLIQMLAVCVLLFSVHSKLAQYRQSAASSGAAKLWLNGQKIELQASQQDKSFLIVPWAMTFVGLTLLTCRFSAFDLLFFHSVPQRRSSFQPRLRLRPPPLF